jgi:SnoaL-like domain
MTTTATSLVTALTEAIEARDAAGQLAWYQPDAEIVIVDHDNPPSRPKRIQGSADIRAHLADVCDREMTHEVRVTLTSPDNVAFEVHCTYPDGTRVLCLCLAGVTDDRIAWQHTVQAWDH